MDILRDRYLDRQINRKFKKVYSKIDIRQIDKSTIDNNQIDRWDT